MISLKARLFNFIARHSYLLRGRLSKEVFNAGTSIDDFRDRCEKGSRYSRIPTGITIRKESMEGLHCEFLIPEMAPEDKMILYFHGGGYVSGSCNDHRSFVAKFANYTGFTCLVFEYGLAPELPYPKAVQDSLSIYNRLLKNGFKSQNILFAGESAGGGLCLATLLALKDKNIELPVASVAISPWTDLTCSGTSYRTKNYVSPAPANSWYVFAEHYAGDNDKTLPYISPLFGDLHGLPPLFVCSGMDDELYDDGESFYLKAQRSGVDITFRPGNRMIHCYPLLAPLFKEATIALTEIADFVRKHL